MVTGLLSFLAGAATGILSGFGVGGGTLLLLWLTLVQGMAQFQAGGINLLYFAACALPALASHLRHGLVERRALLWCVCAGVPASLAAAFLASRLDVALLRRLFGVFLLGVGVRELFFHRKKPPNPFRLPHKRAQKGHTSHETQSGETAGKSNQKG